MKSSLIFLTIILLPLSIYALAPLSETELSNINGQAGVNINTNLFMDIVIDTMAWGDSDGIKSVFNPWDAAGVNTSGGYVGINSFNITNLVIKGRTEADDNYNGYNTLMIKPITIDVATVDASNLLVMTAAASVSRGYVATENMVSGTTFVRFGIGALEISMDAMQFDVSLSGRVNSTNETAGSNTVSLSQNMGTVSMGALAMYISPWSYVDIYSTDGLATTGNKSGICFAVNVTIDKFKMDYMSWGDKDGFAVGNTTISNGTATQQWMNEGTYQTAGYVGLSNMYVGPININGTAKIDVYTVKSGIYAQFPRAISGK